MRKKEKLFEYLKDHISIDLNGIAAIKMLHVKQTNVKRYNSKMLHVKHLDRNVTQ